MRKYEYMNEFTSEKEVISEAYLTLLGDQGWRLVAIIPVVGDKTQLILCREVE